MKYILFIVIAQAAYSIGDTIRKFILHGQPFDWSLLKSIPFILTFALSAAAFILQLYVLKHFDLSRTIVVLACAAVVFSAILGAVFFKERMNIYDIFGVAFAILAVIFMHIE